MGVEELDERVGNCAEQDKQTNARKQDIAIVAQGENVDKEVGRERKREENGQDDREFDTKQRDKKAFQPFTSRTLFNFGGESSDATLCPQINPCADERGGEQNE